MRKTGNSINIAFHLLHTFVIGVYDPKYKLIYRCFDYNVQCAYTCTIILVNTWAGVTKPNIFCILYLLYVINLILNQKYTHASFRVKQSNDYTSYANGRNQPDLEK